MTVFIVTRFSLILNRNILAFVVNWKTQRLTHIISLILVVRFAISTNRIIANTSVKMFAIVECVSLAIS